jgi:hypothetical protein
MSHEFSSDNLGSDMQRLESGDTLRLTIEAPVKLDFLPDGRESLVAGDPERCKDFNHPQGDNTLGYKETCGIVSCVDILQQFGVEVTENDLAHYARDHGECTTDPTKEQKFNGRTTQFDQVHLLVEHGVPAHVEEAKSLEELAGFIEQGHGVIAEVNAGELWDDPNHPDPNNASYYDIGEANHAIVITGVARDPATGILQGFYINDSGSIPLHSAYFVDVEKMQKAFIADEIDAGLKLAGTRVSISAPGTCVVTDVVRT